MVEFLKLKKLRIECNAQCPEVAISPSLSQEILLAGTDPRW